MSEQYGSGSGNNQEEEEEDDDDKEEYSGNNTPANNTTTTLRTQNDEIINSMGDSEKALRTIPLVNQPVQSLVLIVILLLAIITNGSVILNISRDSLKLRMVHFLLIRHVCITDSVGALFVLPVPLVSFIKGYWDWGDTACTVISTTTACCWTMHLVAVALYRADRVFAVWLPTGRYPVITPRTVNFLLVLIWATALSGSYLATYTFTPTFQPALALCIPNVPLIFFILVFACYCLGLITLTTGYVFAFVRRRRKKRKRACPEEEGEQRGHHNEHEEHQGSASLECSSTPPSVLMTGQKRATTPPDICNNNRLVVMMMTEEGDDGGGSSNHQHHHHQISSSSSSQRPPRAVVFNEHTTASTPTPTSNNSVVGSMNRPLTPPFASARVQHTHRRVHSDDPCIHQIVGASRESVVSVQYRSLSKHESSDECVEGGGTYGAEDSVAERLDECDVSGVVSSSAATSDNNNRRGSENCPPGNSGNNGVVGTSVRRRKKKKANPRCRVFASYAVSIGHLILYLPAMLVVGVLGGNLPPGVAFLCGIVVYCEFIVQPIALLLVSPKLRGEVVLQVKGHFSWCLGRRRTSGSSSTSNEPDDDYTHECSGNNREKHRVTAGVSSVSVGGGEEMMEEQQQHKRGKKRGSDMFKDNNSI